MQNIRFLKGTSDIKPDCGKRYSYNVASEGSARPFGATPNSFSHITFWYFHIRIRSMRSTDDAFVLPNHRVLPSFHHSVFITSASKSTPAVDLALI